jgi:nicotinate-nucleotide pyrophosphorylase (carboxylating)
MRLLNKRSKIDFPKQCKKISPSAARRMIDAALKEDLGSKGDITSIALLSSIQKKTRAKVIAKEAGILCGIDLFRETFFSIDRKVKIKIFKKDGEPVKKGETLLELTGNPSSLLTGERTALNFLGLLSGIATKAYKLSSLIKDYPTRLLDTRKTFPGLRELEKYAVYQGGGANHRIGLYDMILIKENHIAAIGGLSKAVMLAKRKFPKMVIEVECADLGLVNEALSASADIIMLDNMDNRLVRQALKIVNGRKYTEVSGNIDEKRLVTLAKMGVDFISMGALTHTVKPLDISMLIKGSIPL